MISTIKYGMRYFLEANRYYLQQRRALPYGLDYMLDIERLCRAWQLSVRTFFDVGANWGETSAMALRRFPDARIFAFEPSVGTFKKLCDHLGNEPRFSAHNIASVRLAGRYHSSSTNRPSITAWSPTPRMSQGLIRQRGKLRLIAPQLMRSASAARSATLMFSRSMPSAVIFGYGAALGVCSAMAEYESPTSNSIMRCQAQGYKKAVSSRSANF
jgi:FkbM family methyltransferase